MERRCEQDTSKAVARMSDQQIQGLALALVGVAVLIVSLGVAWTLMLRSRARRVESAWLISLVSCALLVVGAVVCYFGVSAFLGDRRYDGEVIAKTSARCFSGQDMVRSSTRSTAAELLRGAQPHPQYHARVDRLVGTDP